MVFGEDLGLGFRFRVFGLNSGFTETSKNTTFFNSFGDVSRYICIIFMILFWVVAVVGESSCSCARAQFERRRQTSAITTSILSRIISKLQSCGSLEAFRILDIDMGRTGKLQKT